MSCSYTAGFVTFGGGGGWDMDPFKNLVKRTDPFSEKYTLIKVTYIMKLPV